MSVHCEKSDKPRLDAYRSVLLLLGPFSALVLFLVPRPVGLDPAGWATAAVALWMAIWWASETVPLAATALLPLVFLPLLGVQDIHQTAAPFAHPLIFLFLGGFLLALAMQRWNLHRRIALHVVALVGQRPSALVGGVMLASAFLSMWISNTATAMMMMPIAASLITVAEGDGVRLPGGDVTDFGVALMLGTAYAASIGGLATLVGSPPNALLAAFMAQTYGFEIGFAQWMLIGLPVVALMLPLTWFVLTKIMFRVSSEHQTENGSAVLAALDELGSVSTEEKRVAAVFALVAFLWMIRPLLDGWLGPEVLSDSGIVIAGALLLFVLPAKTGKGAFLLDWAWAKRAPWDILILFGGGLSLAQAIDRTGLAAWIGSGLQGFDDKPIVLLVAATACLIILLTELTSNTATTAAFLPVVGAVALQADLPPVTLAAPAALAASCAFMLPVATPPNAIVFGSGHVRLADMLRVGVVLNVLGIAVITAMTLSIFPYLFA